MLELLPAWAGPVIVIVHGISHAGAIGALAWVHARPGTDTGGWTAARSRLLPGLAPDAATRAAAATWAIACVLFVVAGSSLVGLGPEGWWRPAAVAGAAVSLAGIVAFAGTWPAFNTVAAATTNLAILAVALATTS
jgi:hypothetical protein